MKVLNFGSLNLDYVYSVDHMVMPGMVYLSQPTEYGTLYTAAELREISALCREAGIPLYIDGARLAYALACPENDLTLPELARLCDVFYIGGTKCGALFGEADSVLCPQMPVLRLSFCTGTGACPPGICGADGPGNPYAGRGICGLSGNNYFCGRRDAVRSFCCADALPVWGAVCVFSRPARCGSDGGVQSGHRG